MEITIQELAGKVKEAVGYTGSIKWDKNKPDGTPRKQLEVILLKKLGWKHTMPLYQGIESVYKNYLKKP